MADPLIRTVPMTGLAGLRNRGRPERLEPGSLVFADNVDCDDSQTLERRDGYALALGLDECTSAYAARDGERLFLVEAGTLVSLDSTLTRTVLTTGLVDSVLLWAEAAPYVYYAGAHDAGMIVGGVEHRALRVPSPVAPTLRVTSGDLPAGQYQATCLWRDRDTGMESSAPVAAVIDLAEGEGLSITASTAPGMDTLIYLSEPNGDRMYLLTESSAVIVSSLDLLDLAHPLHDEQYAMNPLPEGVTALAWHEGRLWAATQDAGSPVSVVWFSQPFWPSQWNVAADYFLVDGTVLGLASTSAGLLVATQKALWLYTPDEALQQLTHYGAVPGYPITQDRNGLHYVWTVKGLVSFPPLTPLTEGKVFVKPGAACSTAVVERRGRRQVVVLTDGQGAAYNPY